MSEDCLGGLSEDCLVGLSEDCLVDELLSSSPSAVNFVERLPRFASVVTTVRWRLEVFVLNGTSSQPSSVSVGATGVRC